MQNHIVLVFCYFLIGPWLYGMDANDTQTLFRFERTAHQGLILRTQAPLFEPFVLDGPKMQEACQKLLNDPCGAFSLNIKLMKPCFELSKTCHQAIQDRDRKRYDEAWNELRSSFITAHQTFPMVFSDECTQCALHRRADKQGCPRERFCMDIEASLVKTDEPLNPVFYGAGDCFAELEILVRLKKAGHTLNRVTLIDPMYKDFMTNLTRLLSPEKNNVTAADLNFRVQPLVLKFIFEFTEILYLLNHLEEGASIALYASHDNYIEDHAELSRLMVALDFQADPCKHNSDLFHELDELFLSKHLVQGGLMAKAYSDWDEVKKVLLTKIAR